MPFIDTTNEEATSPNISIPRPEIVLPSPVVTPNQVTTTEATLDVTPAWYKPIESIPENKIRFPAYSGTDVRH